MPFPPIYLRRSIFAVCTMLIALTLLAAAGVISSGSTHAQDKLSKFLLLKLSRDQSAVLCKSEVFTQCMAFTETQCLELSEKALDECMGPLPDTINLADLQNETLEECPKKVYEDAGYTDEKAQQCLQEALK